MKEFHFDFDQTQIINNVIEALDFIDKEENDKTNNKDRKSVV